MAVEPAAGMRKASAAGEHTGRNARAAWGPWKLFSECLMKLRERKAERLERKAEKLVEGGEIYAAAVLGKPAVPALAKKLRAERDEWEFAKIVSALGRIGDEAAVRVLADAMHREDPQLRSRAALGLGEIGDVSAVPALLKALGDSDKIVQWRVLRALKMLVDKHPEHQWNYAAAALRGYVARDGHASDVAEETLRVMTRTP